MAFKRIGYLGSEQGAPIKVTRIAANSITVSELDAVTTDTDGFAALGSAAANVLGHVLAIRTNKGVGVDSTGAAGAEFGSFVGTFTTASDNETVGKVKVEVDITKNALYSAEVDAAIGSTPGSNLAGYFMDLADEDTLDESTAAATAAQYATHGVDIQDSSKAVVNIFESQVFGPLGA